MRFRYPYFFLTSILIQYGLCKRPADRDMAMRYYWGLGIGHMHTHGNVDKHAEHSVNPTTTEKSGDDSESEASSAPVEDEVKNTFEGEDGDVDLNSDSDMDSKENASSEDRFEGEDEELLELIDTYGLV